MRIATALKVLFRSPVKTLLTFLLIAAASYTLFSRVADYTVTQNQVAEVEKYYHGVAALDTSGTEMIVEGDLNGTGY